MNAIFNLTVLQVLRFCLWVLVWLLPLSFSYSAGKIKPNDTDSKLSNLLMAFLIQFMLAVLFILVGLK